MIVKGKDQTKEDRRASICDSNPEGHDTEKTSRTRGSKGVEMGVRRNGREISIEINVSESKIADKRGPTCVVF